MWVTSSLTAWTKSSWPAIPDVTTANCLQLYLEPKTNIMGEMKNVVH